MEKFSCALVACIAAAIVGDCSSGRAAQQGSRATISAVAWLSGTWQGANGPVTFEERWTAPAGGAMLAVARTIKAGRMVAFEFLRIVERDGSLVYIAQPGGRPPTEFALTQVGPESATFENRSHDFPKMIRYATRADGSLEARISDGAERIELFVFRRQLK